MARTFRNNSSATSSRRHLRSSHTRPGTTGKNQATKTNCSKQSRTKSSPKPSDDDKDIKKASITDHLSSYFRDLSEHALLVPEQEKEFARGIEEHEVKTWRLLLSNPSIAEYILDWFEMNAETTIGDGMLLRRAATTARSSRTKTKRRKLATIADTIADEIRSRDLDRVHIDALLLHLHELEVGAPGTRGTKLPFSLRSRSFGECMRAARSSDCTAVTLRNDFVHANLRLVVTMARRYDQGGMPLADLIQEGNLGLMHAVSRFDHRRGLRFSTYACWWIRHAIGRALADKSRTVRIPVHMLEAQAQLQKAHQLLFKELGRKPTKTELSQATKLPTSKIEQMHRYLMGQPLSLDRPAHDNDDRAFGELIPDPITEEISPEDRLTARSLVDRVQSFMLDLTPIEADVIRQRFGLRDDQERTFREIGAQYHLSRERIRQIQNSALSKLREALMSTL